jgi:mono/diheme cytochrome c family protein
VSDDLKSRLQKIADDAMAGVELLPSQLLAAAAARRDTRRRRTIVVAVLIAVAAITITGLSVQEHRSAVGPASTSSSTMALGQQLYSSSGCAACHGARGEGGVGPRIAGGEAAKVFPNVSDEIAFIKSGSGPYAGQRYGSPTRPGGQAGPAKGIMPAFGGSLSDTQIAAIVTYERAKL